MTPTDLGPVPAEQPLTYPGRPVTEPTLLAGDELLPWDPAALTGRTPVIAVGSNASPAQLRHKLRREGLSGLVPLAPAEVRGIAVGCSAHIGVHGYVAAAPYAAPGTTRTLVISWLDPAQLAAVDRTEFNYQRIPAPGGTGFLYVSRHGILADPDTGRPHPGARDQRALLTALLAASPRLRALLGPGPEHWVARARAEPEAREAGKRIFVEEGWVRPAGLVITGEPSTPRLSS
ncbi:hypothetical protein [Streptomyces morookaense]|uniref:Uncharacterized protein n=1 Tax=Streptomyces morookaense TaxID=1970 RepID=A0A7Y7E9X4_STRMO|nr:hypothetical protein [Streptomyces morookaense]NVK80881.1 hypothetical protein [Streptomyces morookaense]GHF13339.1 hypothetical protein GCM10010359_13160 [Streptomyces morookaense]